MSMNYRYWKLESVDIQSGTGPFVLIEYLKITATAAGATLLTGGTASASSEYNSTYLAANAFVDDTTSWACVTSGLPATLTYDMGVGISVTGRYLELRGYTPNHIYSPKHIRLFGSNDGTTWVELLDVTINGYASTDRWVVVAGTVRIPFGFTVSGNSKHDDGTAVQKILVSDWSTGKLIDTVYPVVNGNWICDIVPEGDVAVIHIGDSGYEPAVDGPVTPALR